MNKLTNLTTRQPKAISTPLASSIRHALYLTLALCLFVLVALWAGNANPTTADTLYQTKDGGVETEGGARLPTCDPNWQIVSSPDITRDAQTTIRDVEVIAPNDVWTVGYYASGGASRALIIHWDGASWTIAPGLSPTIYSNLLGITAVAANDIWAVGSVADPMLGNKTLTMHWNGSAWSVVNSPDVGDSSSLTGVAAVSANEVWAVGYYVSPPSQRTLAMRWNGTTWAHVSTPNVNSSNNLLQGIAVVDSSGIWAVGYYLNAGVSRTLSMRWNGSAWSIVTTPNTGTGNNQLYKVEVVANNDIWAVGSYQGATNRRTLIMRYNGTTWGTVTSPNVNTENHELFGLEVVSATEVWAVGYYDDLESGSLWRTLTMRWNGSVWSIVASPNHGSDHNWLYSVSAGPTGGLWAGGYYNNPGSHSLAQQWNGSSWNEVATPDVTTGVNRLWDLDATSSSNIWAVGEAYNDINRAETLIQLWNGSYWSVVPSPNAGTGNTNNYLKSIEISSPSDIWAVGYYNDTGSGYDRTLILHWNGSSWSVVSSPNVAASDNYLTSVTSNATNDVWAVGFSADITGANSKTLTLHWNGAAWSIVASPNVGSLSSALNGVTAVSANEVWAAGSYVSAGAFAALILRWNGSAWNVVASPGVGEWGYFLTDISAASTNDIWAVGSYNNTLGGAYHTLIYHWNGAAWSAVSAPDTGPGSHYPLGVAAVSPADAWMVGYYDDGTTTRTLIQRWNGSSWSTVTSPNPSASHNLLSHVAVVSTAPTDVWAVGHHDSPTSQHTVAERLNPCVATATPTTAPTQTPGGPTATPAACTIQFTDVPEGSTFYDFVRCMACQGIINGYSSGCETGNPCFRPNNNVTRGQLSKIVANAAAFNEPVGAQQYEDVPPGSTFYDFVWRLANRTIVSGYPCGGPGEPCNAGNLPYFRPNGNATRGQISKIVASAANLSDPTGTQQFEDVAPGSTFYDFVQRLANLGAMSGYPCGGPGEPCNPPNNMAYFRPQNNATRGQTSKIVSATFFPNCNPTFSTNRKQLP